jgi:hypothetical protein
MYGESGSDQNRTQVSYLSDTSRTVGPEKSMHSDSIKDEL